MKKFFFDLQTYQLGYSLVCVVILFYVKKIRISGAYSCLKYIKFIGWFSTDTANMCLAEIYYYIAQYDDSITLLKTLKNKYPHKEDLYYLEYKCYMCLGKKQDAIQILEDLLTRSKRKKTWLYWSNSVSNKQDFENFERAFIHFNEFKKINDINLINYYAEAALNAGQYSEAIDIWKKSKFNKIKVVKMNKKFTADISRDAENALVDLKRLLEHHKINFFIISGTLLGCIRENKILSHDKDIDIGVFENKLDIDHLIFCLKQSGFFEFMPVKHEKYIKIKHLNGIFVDIFIHYQDHQYYYHRTAKIEWRNKKFTLKKIKFLNHDFFIPSNYQLYLTENYGQDWMIPKINFDSNFDTPNAKILNTYALAVFCEKIKMYQHLKLKYLNKTLPQI